MYAQPLSHTLNLHLRAWVERQHDKEENTDSNADFTASCKCFNLSELHVCVKEKESEYIEITDVLLQP